MVEYFVLIFDIGSSRYNIDNVGSEGGLPNVVPAFASGQDGLLASLESKGTHSSIYCEMQI